jgi:hypothetical protein
MRLSVVNQQRWGKLKRQQPGFHGRDYFYNRSPATGLGVLLVLVSTKRSLLTELEAQGYGDVIFRLHIPG